MKSLFLYTNKIYNTFDQNRTKNKGWS